MTPTETITVAAAVNAVAKTSEPLVAQASKLLGVLFGKPFQIAGQIAVDQLDAWKWARRVAILNKAESLFAANPHVAKRALPPGFLEPFLFDAGYVDDSELQEIWSNLLVNASGSEEYAQRLYVETVKVLSPADALLFHHIAGFPAFEITEQITIANRSTPTSIVYHYGPKRSAGHTTQANIANLTRLGLIAETDRDKSTMDKVRERLGHPDKSAILRRLNRKSPKVIRTTLFGKLFYAAISTPKAPASETTSDPNGSERNPSDVNAVE